MPTALSDPSTSLYVILVVISVILGSIALRRQKRSDAINFAIPLAALLALFLIDFFVQSPREQIAKSIQEMEAATQNKKHDEVFKHVSDKFQYKTMDKKAFQEATKFADANPDWQGIKVIGLDRKGYSLGKDETTAEQKFEVQPLRLPGTEYRYECIATFKKEGDAWKLTGFKLMKNGQEVSPPGM